MGLGRAASSSTIGTSTAQMDARHEPRRASSPGQAHPHMNANEICNARDLLEYLRENEDRLAVRVCVGGEGPEARWRTVMLSEATIYT